MGSTKRNDNTEILILKEKFLLHTYKLEILSYTPFIFEYPINQ